MAQTSSVITGSVTLTAASIEPIVTWGLTGFKGAIPETVPYILAAGIVTGAHLIYNLYANRNQPKEPS